MALRAAILGIALAAAAHPAVAAPSKFDAALQTSPNGPVRVLITTTSGSSSDVAYRLQQRGRQVIKQYRLLNLIAADVTPDDFDSLAAD